MGAVRKADVSDALGTLDDVSTALLGPRRERQLLTELADCKRTLVETIARDQGRAEVVAGRTSRVARVRASRRDLSSEPAESARRQLVRNDHFQDADECNPRLRFFEIRR